MVPRKGNGRGLEGNDMFKGQEEDSVAEVELAKKRLE